MADMEKLTEAAWILVSRYFRQFAFVWWRYPASSPWRSNKIFWINSGLVKTSLVCQLQNSFIPIWYSVHNFKLIRAFVILKEITCFNKIVDKISITHPILKSDEKSTQRVFCRNIKNSGFTKDQLNCTLLFTKEPFPLNQFTLYQKPSPISQPLPWDPSIPFHVKLLIKTFAIFKAKRENNNLQIFHIVDSHPHYLIQRQRKAGFFQSPSISLGRQPVIKVIKVRSQHQVRASITSINNPSHEYSLSPYEQHQLQDLGSALHNERGFSWMRCTPKSEVITVGATCSTQQADACPPVRNNNASHPDSIKDNAHLTFVLALKTSSCRR